MFSDEIETTRNNISFQNDENFIEFPPSDIIARNKITIPSPNKQEENNYISFEKDKEKEKSTGRSFLSLKKFTKAQELQMKNFESLIKENEMLTKKNQEYLKKIDFLQKVHKTFF